MDMIREVREHIIPSVNEIVKPPCEADYNDFNTYSAAVEAYRKQLKRQACIYACALGLESDVYDHACDEYIDMAF
jgi:hypothetical protein